MHPLNDEETKKFVGAFNLDAAASDYRTSVASENVLLANRLTIELKTVLNDLRWQQDLLNQVRQNGYGSVKVKIPNIVGRSEQDGLLNETRQKFIDEVRQRLSDRVSVWFYEPRGFFDSIRGLATIEIEYQEPIRVDGYSGGMSGVSTITSVTTTTVVQPSSGPGKQMDGDSL